MSQINKGITPGRGKASPIPPRATAPTTGRKEYRIESRYGDDEPWRPHATVWKEKAVAVQEWARSTAVAQATPRCICWQFRVTERAVTDWEPIEHMDEAQEALDEQL